VVITVDGGAPTNWETFLRLRRTDTRQFDGCHGGSPQDYVARRPNYARIDLGDPVSLSIASLSWNWIRRLRDTDKMKVVLKGILTHEDAILATNNSIDGIIISKPRRSPVYKKSRVDCICPDPAKKLILLSHLASHGRYIRTIITSTPAQAARPTDSNRFGRIDEKGEGCSDLGSTGCGRVEHYRDSD
jgi:hypothetical protein